MTPEIRRLLDSWRAEAKALHARFLMPEIRVACDGVLADCLTRKCDELEAALLASPADLPRPEEQKHDDETRSELPGPLPEVREVLRPDHERVLGAAVQAEQESRSEGAARVQGLSLPADLPPTEARASVVLGNMDSVGPLTKALGAPALPPPVEPPPDSCVLMPSYPSQGVPVFCAHCEARIDVCPSCGKQEWRIDSVAPPAPQDERGRA